ncbi:MAG: tRNA 2-thiouridine(34) synthase MnmA [Patescibacteria group bacterium]
MSLTAIGLSGGVDSAVAALLLKESGHDLIGVFMKFWQPPQTGVCLSCRENTCCNRESYLRTKRLCVYLGIPLVIYDFGQEFKQKVVDQYIKYYQSGRTPNPCIWCNEHIKFKLFLQRTKKEFKVDHVATGHYAQINNLDDYYYLKKAEDQTKDQTYFLYRLSQNILQRTIFPLGKIIKEEVKKIASLELKKFTFHTTKESQDLCFLPDDQAKNNLLSNLGPGSIKIGNDQIVGTHDGINKYTIGQRHGLNITNKPGPFYVTGLDPKANTVYIGKKSEVYAAGISLKKIIASPMLINKKTYTAKTRSQSRVEKCVALITNNTISLQFVKPQFAPTIGQHTVIYDHDIVVGGGEINRINK